MCIRLVRPLVRKPDSIRNLLASHWPLTHRLRGFYILFLIDFCLKEPVPAEPAKPAGNKLGSVMLVLELMIQSLLESVSAEQMGPAYAES